MPRKLHIGGKERVAGWEVLNIQPGSHVDHVGNANNLAQFSDNTFSEIYASHILEHLDYTGELQSALKEWNRVLVVGGKIHISVPDLDTLCRLLLDKNRLNVGERFSVMRILFGGHVDQYDYHVVGLNFDFLTKFLTAAGFDSIRRVDEFRLFRDTSSMKFQGQYISVNVVATKSG
jgi:predicted SAM-dependent methyltransferase